VTDDIQTTLWRCDTCCNRRHYRFQRCRLKIASLQTPIPLHCSSRRTTRDESSHLTLLPATVFLAMFAGNGGGEMPPDISRVLEHIATKFQRLQPCFRGQSFYWWYFRLPISWDIDVCSKSKMTAKLQSTNNLAGFTDTHVVPKQVQGFMTCTKHINVQQSWPTQPRVENPRWQLTNRK